MSSKRKSRQLEGCSKFRINNNVRPPSAIILPPLDTDNTISLNNEPEDVQSTPTNSSSTASPLESESEPNSPYASQLYNNLPDHDTDCVESHDFELYNPSQIDPSVSLDLFPPSGFFLIKYIHCFNLFK
jgi:hypothetical protein